MALSAQEEERLRKLELEHASLLPQVASLFDNAGSPGLISQLRESLSKLIDGYFQTVSEFIKGEPARKAHIERNMQQAVMDAKALAQDAVIRVDEKQMRMHEENRRAADKDRNEIADLRRGWERHEKFVQRCLGVVIFGQFMIFLAGFIVTLLTSCAALVWWFFSHVAITAAK